ncbi:hypothetical protein ACOCJ5_07055 [Knoellia sp. CPCC 206450]|uniref:hypothetical protein n=1 Tax=Knoellia tibetensis TaxID=3404798 RepID=UPI003B4315F4
MTLTFNDVDLRVDLPQIPFAAPVVAHTPPCLKGSEDTTRAIADVLGIDLKGTAEVPHGYAVGSDRGQVEVFSASGAFRARNVERLTAYEDERRPWRAVERDDSGEWHLAEGVAERVSHHGLEILSRIGIEQDFASLDVVLGQWAQLDEESGKEIDSGPGRATVRLSYAVEGLALIGPGAKTNLHFDPDPDGGDDGLALARMFHVRRATSGVGEVRTQSLDEAFAGLLGQSWSGAGLREGEARMTVTSAVFGLLALPADVLQSYAVPALAVEGSVSGVLVGRDETATVRFGQYLPLAHPKAIAEAGYGGGQLTPGAVVRGSRARGE